MYKKLYLILSIGALGLGLISFSMNNSKNSVQAASLKTYLPSLSSVEIPASLDHLSSEPVGLGMFSTKLVFPLFSLDGKSKVEEYDTKTKTTNFYEVPLSAQKQFAYATSSDSSRNNLWIGTSNQLISFNENNKKFQTTSLPAVKYAYSTAMDHGQTNILGLTVDSNGNVWMTRDHDSGLTKYDPSTQKFVEYPLPTGVVPKDIVELGINLFAMNIYHTNNPKFITPTGNLFTGILVYHTQTQSYDFIPGFAPSVSVSNGQIVVQQQGNLVQINPFTRTQTIEAQGQFGLHTAYHSSSFDGSQWWTDETTIYRKDNSGIKVIAIPSRYSTQSGHLISGQGAPVKDTQVPTKVKLNPDVHSIITAPNGDMWFIAAGYNAIGHVTP